MEKNPALRQVTFLVSGNGGNLKFFHFALLRGLIRGIRINVVADRDCGAVDFARRHQIDSRIVSYKRTESAELRNVLDEWRPDLIVTNWNKIIDESTVCAYRGILVNLHYSLLPAFGGLIGMEPVRRAYAQGCMFIGPTCHIVDEGVDTGPILAQAIFRTDMPFEQAVQVMFRKGCLTLLNGIREVLGCSLVLVTGSSGDSIEYAPRLGYDENIFNESFWGEVAKS